MARTSIIGPTSIVVGDISGRGDLEIVGRVQGDVAIDGSVTVGPAGVILGSIRALDVRVSGRVDGNVVAKESLTLQAGANVSGDLVAARLGIEEGARVRGSVRTDGSGPTEDEEPTITGSAGDEQRTPEDDELVEHELLPPDEPTSDATSEPPAGQERRRRDRRRRRSHGGGAPPPPIGPVPSTSPGPKNLPPSSPALLAPTQQRPQPSGPRREGPPAPVVPALAKGVRGRRRPTSGQE